MPLITNPPPPTPVDPVTEVLHGVPVTDPYRWLEDQNSPPTRKWLEEQTAYTRAYLDAIPGRDRIKERLRELLAVETISEPWKVGNRYFYLKRAPCQEQPVIMMCEGQSGAAVLLVDPALRGEGNALAVSIVNISKDGNLLAYGVRRGGTDSQSVEFLDVALRRTLPDRLPHGFRPGLVFSLDGQGFYYSHEIMDSPRPNYRAIYFHRFGTRRDEDLEIFFAGEDPRLRLAFGESTDGHFLACLVIHSSDPPTFDLYLQNVVSGSPARRIFEGMESVCGPSFAGNKLLVLTNYKSPNLRIVGIDPDHPERDRWIDIIPEREHRIDNFVVAGRTVCVSYTKNLASQIEAFDLTGIWRATVPCPPNGTARLFRRGIEADTLFYGFSSFDQPPTIFSYDTRSCEQKIWARSQVALDSSSVEVEQVRYQSTDGTDIPMFLVARKKQLLSGPLPVFLTGYGGFGVSFTPKFNAYSTFLMEQGLLLAVPNLRGGGEFGGAWYHAGRRHNRQNAIDDFNTAAEWLVAKGYTQRQKIAIGGGSNGGLLVAAALTQRPDLFRAVLCVGPLLDMLRFHIFDSASEWTDEYGSSENREDFFFLLGYSPYHHTEKGALYPAVLLISGDADTRCNPMHARKMAARLQAASNSGHPILLDYKPTWGHVPVQPLNQRIDSLTDRLAFICHELGVTV